MGIVQFFKLTGKKLTLTVFLAILMSVVYTISVTDYYNPFFMLDWPIAYFLACLIFWVYDKNKVKG